MRKGLGRSFVAVVALCLMGSVVGADTLQTFDVAGDTAGWAKDRYAPQVFQSGVTAEGRTGVLQLGLRAEGQQANRTSSFTSDFYNYQGMQYNLGGIESPAVLSVDMYVEDSWTDGTRAGVWLTNSNGNLSYPIIEWVAGSGFRYWQSSIGWTAVGGAYSTDAWYNLSFKLSDNLVKFFIDGSQFGSVSAQGAHQINNVILQGHNQGPAGEYDIYFDNLQAAAVPLPAAAWGGMALMGILAGRRYWKRS